LSVGPRPPSSEAEALLESQGKSIDDLYVAAALHEPELGRISTITALRVDGAVAARLVDAAIPLLLGIERPVTATRTVGESEIETIQVRDQTMPGAYPTTLYGPLGDTLWIVTAHDRRLLGEIVEALPGPGGRVLMPELGVAITLPEDWQVSSSCPSTSQLPSRGPSRLLSPPSSRSSRRVRWATSAAAAAADAGRGQVLSLSRRVPAPCRRHPAAGRRPGRVPGRSG
jgi:hypothetical protein